MLGAIARPRTTILVVGTLAFALVFGCKKDTQGTAPAASDVQAPPVASDAAPDARPARALSTLSVTVDGNPVAIESAIGTLEDRGVVEIELRNHSYTCQEKHEGHSPRSVQPSDVSIRVSVGPYLHASGKLGWAIRRTYFDGSSSEKESGGDPLPEAASGDAATSDGIALDAAPGKRFAVPLDFQRETSGLFGSPKKTIVVRGVADVVGCGESKRNKEAPPAPQGDAVIEIAGRSLPIAGAAIATKKSGETTLLVSTHAVKCYDGSPDGRGDVDIELEWTKTGTLYAAKRDGRWVDWSVHQGSDIGLTANPHRALPGTKEMPIALGGKTTIGGYAVALRGAVRAVVCR